MADRDIVLEQLVMLSEAKEPFELAVTLIVGGFLVSGTIVDRDQWAQHDPTIRDLNDAMAKGATELGLPPDKESSERYFLHLKDARCFVPGQQPIPGNQSVFMRIRLDAVSGFYLGSLSAAKTPG